MVEPEDTNEPSAEGPAEQPEAKPEVAETEPQAAPESTEAGAEAPKAGPAAAEAPEGKTETPSGTDGQAAEQWRVAAPAQVTIAARRAAERAEREAPPPPADTDVAQAAPRPGPVVHRRTFLVGGFWVAAAGLLAAIAGGLGLDFLWIKKIAGFGSAVNVTAATVPAAGADPVRVVEGRFWLVNIPAGTAESPGGLLALYQKCPHLGCTVPWRPDFDFGGVKGWFRCPCHGSTYTKEGGVLVAGPAPHSMDTMAITVKSNGDLTVETGQIKSGGQDNPSRVVPYPGGQQPASG
jgi:cytochrome b6-f complex iron-sulfur subunit